VVRQRKDELGAAGLDRADQGFTGNHPNFALMKGGILPVSPRR
jgi:hypothetical protein